MSDLDPDDPLEPYLPDKRGVSFWIGCVCIALAVLAALVFIDYGR